jgi:hypothetical protein
MASYGTQALADLSHRGHNRDLGPVRFGTSDRTRRDLRLGCGGRVAQNPMDRPMISFWISVVPP